MGRHQKPFFILVCALQGTDTSEPQLLCRNPTAERDRRDRRDVAVVGGFLLWGMHSNLPKQIPCNLHPSHSRLRNPKLPVTANPQIQPSQACIHPTPVSQSTFTTGSPAAALSGTLKVSLPSTALTLTVSPVLIVPRNNSSAIGSSRCRSTARRMGRAP